MVYVTPVAKTTELLGVIVTWVLSSTAALAVTAPMVPVATAVSSVEE